MRNKKFLFMLAALVCVLFVCLASACKKTQEDPIPAEASVTLDRSSAELDVHETIELTASSENTSEKIVWSSSDPAVATVENGLVQAQAKGEATVTASAGGASDTCRITVYDSQSAPVLRLNRDSVPVAKGDTYTVKAEVLYKNCPAYGEVEYTWTEADNYAEGVASIEANGAEAVITGLEYGDTAYDLVAEIWGTKMTARVDVSVRNADIRFETPYGVTDGAYTASLALLDIGEHHTEADLDVKIYEKDVLQDAQITDWKSEDESIVTAENGTITAVAEGSAYVVGSYENNECRILVSVYRPQVEMSERVELQKFGANTVTPESEISGAVKDMLLGGENILVSADGNALTYDQAKLPSASADMGDATVVIGTEKAKYVFEAGIYSRVIRTQADLDAMAADGAAALNDSIFWDGYYVLGADVECNYGEGFYPSVSWPKSFDENGINAYTTNAGFMGIFDGRGYNVDGLRTTGQRAFFLTMAKGGIVKNISFTNAVHTGGTDTAFLATFGHGIFENVYVELNSLDAGNGVFNGVEALSDARVRNCFVVCKSSSENTFLGYKNGTPPGSDPVRHFDKVYSVGLAGDPVMKNWQITGGYADDNDTKNYADFSEMAAAGIDFSGWDKDFWTVVNGLPYPKNLPVTAGEIVWEINVEGEYVGVGAEITYTSEDTILSLDEAAKEAGIVLGGGKIVIPDGEELRGMSFTVTAKNRFGGETESQTFYVVSSSAFEASGSFEAEALGEENTFTLDLSADADEIKGELSSVTLGDKKFADAEYDGGLLTLDRTTIAEDWGKQTVTAVFLVREGDAVTETLTVEIPVLIVTRMIENQTDFEAMAQNGTNALNEHQFWYGYYMLANDIDCDYTQRGVRYPSTNWANAVATPWETDFGFNGVFDGRGYNISGVRTHGLGSVFMGIGSSGTVKNVSFTGAVHNTTSNYPGAFLCSYLHGTIENVYIQFDYINGGTAFNSGYPINDTLKVKNCFAEAVVADPSAHVGITCQTSSAERVPFENVYSVGFGKGAICDDWEMTDYNVTENFASREQMAAAEIDFVGWDESFWTVVEGIPFPKGLQFIRMVAVEQIFDVSMTAAGDAAAFDLSEYFGSTGTVSATLNGAAVAVSGTPAELVFTKEQLYADAYGNKTLVLTVVKDGETAVAAAVFCVASHVVKTVGDFDAAIPGGAYVVLADDLYFEGNAPTGKSGTFAGVFDGRGHILDGITLNNDQYLFCYTMNGTIRNVAITDLRLGIAAALYGEGKGLAENVYVQASSAQTGYGGWHTGFFGANNSLEGNRVKNCLVVVDSVEIGSGGNVYGSGGHYDERGYLDGFYMIGVTDRCMATNETKHNGDPLDPSDTEPSGTLDDCAGYADRAAMKAAVESGEIGFDDWDKDFWAFDEDGLPVPAHMPE